ncbi:hypothetical protein ACH4SK_11700 [Streptomyces inhibens]|uniref:hypothetical protein n=1 Tax=Streptomyces inhibens TaxID=2293571 RepID=UPI0037BA9E6E
MAAITRFHITFGLVSIPVSIHSATERRAVPLHQVHAKDGSSLGEEREVTPVKVHLCSSVQRG